MDSNEVFYNQRLSEHKNWGAQYPEAAALSDLINESIINKSYKIYNHNDINTYNKFDIIVAFNIVDPIFGLFELDGNYLTWFSKQTVIGRFYL